MKIVGAKVSNLKWSQLAVLLVCITLKHVLANECVFVNFDEPVGNSCFLFGATITANKPVTFTGENFEGKNDSDVTYIAFFTSTVETFPNECFKKFPNVKTITVSNCKLMQLKQYNFKGATKLENFFARSNNMRSLFAETFIGSKNLKKLNLGNNQLAFIREEAFKHLTKLESLTMDQNLIRTLNDNTFEDLVSLKEVDLQGNMLFKISEKLFRNNLKLEAILLRKNKIHNISADSFKNLESLKGLDLRNNQCINNIFDDTGNFTSLTALNDEITKCAPKNLQQEKYELCMEKLN